MTSNAIEPTAKVDQHSTAYEEYERVPIEPGPLSLLPVVTALCLAFITRDAALSLLAGCVVGVMALGADPASGLAQLLRSSLGNEDFIWVMLIELCVGILVALYIRAGVISAFTAWALEHIQSPVAAKGFAWLLGVCVFFSDYFSPIFSGPILRPVTDKLRVSREMLAYLLDSGSAPVCTLIPISGWAVYIAALLQGYGPIESVEDGMTVFVQSIAFNVYGWLAVIVAGLVAFQLLPNFGPMRAAEKRARETGRVIRDGATPLSGTEFETILQSGTGSSNLILYFLIPNLLVVGIAVGTFLVLGSTKILEAFLAAIMYLSAAMAFGGHFKNTQDAMSVSISGMKAVLPAVVILGAAYCINSISRSLGAPEFILSMVSSWMTPGMLPFVTFAAAAVISFFTGTSWGTYAILVPFTMPLAFSLSGDTISTGVLLTVGALTGGALFGDHCSPISDTTSLASFGAGSDHMDHVITQLPYAIGVALIAGVVYLVWGGVMFGLAAI